MRLNGKGLRILPGAIAIFLHVPFSRCRKKALEAHDLDTLEQIHQRVIAIRKAAYHESKADGVDNRAITRRLDTSAAIDFTPGEHALVVDVLEQVVLEDDPPESLNVYFNWDPYRIKHSDLVEFLDRFSRGAEVA